MSDAIQPFRIEASDANLDDLQRRLRATRWPNIHIVQGKSIKCCTDKYAYLKMLH